jgi:hypothetical protein
MAHGTVQRKMMSAKVCFFQYHADIFLSKYTKREIFYSGALNDSLLSLA